MKWNITHGLWHHPLYKVWRNMNTRCGTNGGTGGSDHNRRNYYDRGIRVCKSWRGDPTNFIEWALSNGWQKGLEIDRIDNEKGYSPKNCRFVTRSQNAQNRRVTEIFRKATSEVQNRPEVKEAFRKRSKKLWKNPKHRALMRKAVIASNKRRTGENWRRAK